MCCSVRLGLLLAIFCGIAGLAHAQDNRYVSNDACKLCHPFEYNNFYKNPHFKSVASGKEAPENTGCRNAHPRT